MTGAGDEWEEFARRGRSHAVLLPDMVAHALLAGSTGHFLKCEFNPKSYRQFDSARWFRRADVDGWIRALEAGMDKNPKYLLELAREMEGQIIKCRAWASKVSEKKNFGDSLVPTLHSFFENQYPLAVGSYTFVALNRFLPERIAAIAAKRTSDPKLQAEYLEALLSADRPTGALKEKQSLSTVALRAEDEKLSLDHLEIATALERHAQEYAYLGYYVFYGQPYTKEVMRKRLAEIVEKGASKEAESLKKSGRMRARALELYDELELSAGEKLEIEGARAWIFVYNELDETYGLLTHRCRHLLEEAGERMGAGFSEVIEMTAEEILSALQNGRRLSEGELQKIGRRYDNHALVLEGGKITLYEGKGLEEYFKREKKHEGNLHHLRELRGQSASAGLVMGRAVVVHGIDELAKVRKGDVMVVASTTPAFVPAMERAAAIVTNEGGLLCHAAIVSRELGVPCVVGTKMATRVFQDGDLVEVDAVKGIVRKIS